MAKGWGAPNITFAIGIEQDDPDMPYTVGQFEAQLTAICSVMSNLESADAIRHVASYLDVTADLFICTG
uniref:Copine domain-containing protein n=1 Tax=Globodera pallida TaxID=36090 RepID=A0A183CRZ5_GLOPA